MFSGITQGLYQIAALEKKANFIDYTVTLSEALCDGLSSGQSIAIDGVCQTVVDIQGICVRFQAIEETLNKTTLRWLNQGDWVSVERSLRLGDEIGGHEVSGHVFGLAKIQQRYPANEQLTLLIQCNPAWMKYILPKGFIALDGSSLTVGETNAAEGCFYVHLIPETLDRTRFGSKQIGDKINLEFDQKTKTLVDTVERILPSYLKMHQSCAT